MRIKPLTVLAVPAAVVLVVVAVVYLTMSHPKHAFVFFGLAVLALIGAWFSTSGRARPDSSDEAKQRCQRRAS